MLHYKNADTIVHALKGKTFSVVSQRDYVRSQHVLWWLLRSWIVASAKMLIGPCRPPMFICNRVLLLKIIGVHKEMNGMTRWALTKDTMPRESQDHNNTGKPWNPGNSANPGKLRMEHTGLRSMDSLYAWREPCQIGTALTQSRPRRIFWVNQGHLPSYPHSNKYERAAQHRDQIASNRIKRVIMLKRFSLPSFW